MRTLLAFCMFITISLSNSEDFNYADKGPDSWPALVNGKCAGEKQSPIDIYKCDTVYNSDFKDYTFGRYASSVNWKVTNDGTTIKFTPSGPNLTMTGSDLKKTYTLLQFHFHWGENDYQGSEHYIDEYKYPLEVHFVHQAPDGEYAVLGFFFRLDNNTNTALSAIIEAAVKTQGSASNALATIDLSTVLPLTQKLKYFRYEGSLTTPPCLEGIRWTVFEDTIPISQAQLDAFHGNIIKKNFRSLQKIRKRNIYSNTKYIFDDDKQTCSEASTVRKSYTLEIFALAFLLAIFA